MDKTLFPRKTTGILVVTLLFLSVLSGFAGLYVGTRVFPSGKTPLDALYISFFIMGFTDYPPAPGYGQLVVMAQLVSGVLLLAALFPIHSHEFPRSKADEHHWLFRASVRRLP
jgi:hypothetical protein